MVLVLVDVVLLCGLARMEGLPLDLSESLCLEFARQAVYINASITEQTSDMSLNEMPLQWAK
jgi:hypothetical protein